MDSGNLLNYYAGSDGRANTLGTVYKNHEIKPGRDV